MDKVYLPLLCMCIGLDISNCATLKRSSGYEIDSIIGTYASFAQITEWIYDQANTYPDLVEVLTIGNSHEGRPLLLMKIGWASNNEKNSVWVDSGIHAREWISHASLLYALDQILRGSCGKYQSTLAAVTLYALPVVNPDGYEFSMQNTSSTRLWRKNRRDNSHDNASVTVCPGVDLNRNFNVGWNDLVRSTNDSCDEVYHGPHAMSEPEVKAVGDFVMEHRQTIKASIHLHSFSQKILHCFGYTKEAPVGRDEEINLGREVAEKILEVTGVKYTTGASSTTLYQYSGGCADWMAMTAGIPIAITMELRDTGDYGFILPANQIEGTGTEVLIMLESATKLVANMN